MRKPLQILTAGILGVVVAVVAAIACDPTVIVGSRFCAEPPADGSPSPDPGTPVPLPWTTGFEAGFCDYGQPLGFCFATGTGSFSIVTTPVHSGRYAAAFTVVGQPDGGGGQARCVQQGRFPGAAYYGAWYYVPAFALNQGNWNFLHFQGGDGGAVAADGGAQGGAAGPSLHGLWDVSLVNRGDAGALYMNLFDFLHPRSVSSGGPQIPIGQWFHLEVFFKRADDATGEIAIWQDGTLLSDLPGVSTDDSEWGQWYVGNLADALMPPVSTVYVDDVTIAATRQ